MTGRKRSRVELSTPQPESIKHDIKPTVEVAKFLDDNLSRDTLFSAVSELRKDAARHKQKVAEKLEADGEVFEQSDVNFFLQLTLKTPPEKHKLRPVAVYVPLKHSLSNEDDDVILFVKDPQRLVKDYLERHGNGGVTRVLGVEKVRKRYGTYEARRELLRQYDRFLVDRRVAPMMPRLLGKAFIEGKRMPLVVDLKHDVTASIKRALASTPFTPRRGTSTSILVGNTSMTPEQIADNVYGALQFVLPKLDAGVMDLQSINVKTSKSPALPVFVALPDIVPGDDSNVEEKDEDQKMEETEQEQMQEQDKEKKVGEEKQGETEENEKDGVDSHVSEAHERKKKRRKVKGGGQDTSTTANKKIEKEKASKHTVKESETSNDRTEKENNDGDSSSRRGKKVKGKKNPAAASVGKENMSVSIELKDSPKNTEKNNNNDTPSRQMKKSKVKRSPAKPKEDEGLSDKENTASSNKTTPPKMKQKQPVSKKVSSPAAKNLKKKSPAGQKRKQITK